MTPRIVSAESRPRSRTASTARASIASHGVMASAGAVGAAVNAVVAMVALSGAGRMASDQKFVARQTRTNVSRLIAREGPHDGSCTMTDVSVIPTTTE